MKTKLFSVILGISLAMMLAGCEKKEPQAQPKAKSLNLEVSYNLQGNTEGADLKWVINDAGKLGVITGKGVVSSSKVDIDNQKATFLIQVMDNEKEIYCFYPANTKATIEATEIEIAASRTDENAGDAIGTQLPMVSAEAVKLTKETEGAEVEMKIIPALLRISIYSSEVEYGSENISGISLNAAEKINGIYSWNFTTSEGTVVNGTNNSSVKFKNHYELDGITTAKAAKVIYLPVAPVVLSSGYEIRIATQKATYVYKGTDNAFEAGVVKEINIDLKETERNAKDIITFDASGLHNLELAANGTAIVDKVAVPESVGTFTALVNGNPSEEYTKDYYQSLTLKITDSEGATPTWLTASIGENGAIMMTWEINPLGTPRTAIVEATYNSIEDVYYENPAFTFTVTQLGTVVNYKVSNLSKNYNLKATSVGFSETDLGYFHAYVNCTIDEGEKTSATEKYWYDLQFEYKDTDGKDIDWLEAKVDGDHLKFTCKENKESSSRTGKLLIFNPISGEQLMQADGKAPLVYIVEQKGLGEKSILTYKWNSQNNTPIAGEGGTDIDFGYYQAYIDGNSTAEPTSANYYNVTYTYVDDNAQPVTWLSAKRGATNHPLVTVEPNTGGIRRATVLAHYQDEYTIADDPAFSFTVTQGPAAGINYVTYTWNSGEVKEARQSGYNNWDLGYYQAFVNGSTANEYAANGNVYTPRYNITITLEPAEAAEWLTVTSNYQSELEKDPTKGGGNHLYAKMSKNDTGTVREVIVKAHYTNEEYSTIDPIFSFKIRQAEK